MARKPKANTQNELFDIQEQLKTAPCVPAIRQAVAVWKQGGYKGTTDTTKELLNYWFYTDHVLPNGKRFKYHKAQQEAIETLIYIFEIEKIRNRKDLLEKYAFNTKDLRLPPYDAFARYCIKMATGSGKTKVMSLAIAWQYFNAVKEDENIYAKNFLLIAPNVIVFDRLRSDFESGKIFKTDPLYPRHYELFWNFDFYMRGDTERSPSEGALYLTNIQQFYERTNRNADEETNIMTDMLGSKPPANKSDIIDFDERIVKREGKLMLLNDEAHHTHDEENEWNNIIRALHTKKNIAVQLDVSATPRYSKGALFAWTVFDYPLKQAILDGIVKRPIKGISKLNETKSEYASVRYKGYLTAGVERWKEYATQLKPLRKKPILFLMMNSTDEAQDVGAWLQEKYPEYFSGDKTVIIHTDKSGDVSKKDLEIARTLAKEVDKETSPVNAIVSVLMLREGWDVQNVTVVVGLRPYTAKANILPEQTIGRGLRLMFRGIADNYQERVDIIGNKAFMEFVDDLEKIEDLKFDTYQIGIDKLKIVTIQSVKEKLNVDIGIPDISPILGRKKSLADEISGIDVMSFNCNPIPLKQKEAEELTSFIYEGIDIITNKKVFEKEYTIPPIQTAEEIIGYYARRISQNIKLPSQFAVLAPKVKEFFERKAFGKQVDLSTPQLIQAMSSNVASYVVINVFEKALRTVVVEEKKPELITEKRMLSNTPAFPFSRPLYKSNKTVFNFVACDNEFEKEFAKFLDNAADVKAFAKLPEQFGFCIPYTDKQANIRNYYPDFIAIDENEKHWLLETKGREDIEVALKDSAAVNWCENATNLTAIKWGYLKVLQTEFQKLRPDDLSELHNI
jgi:type III restriction enzyme